MKIWSIAHGVPSEDILRALVRTGAIAQIGQPEIPSAPSSLQLFNVLQKAVSTLVLMILITSQLRPLIYTEQATLRAALQFQDRPSKIPEGQNQVADTFGANLEQLEATIHDIKHAYINMKATGSLSMLYCFIVNTQS